MKKLLILAIMLMVPLLGISQTFTSSYEKAMIIEEFENIEGITEDSFKRDNISITVDWETETMTLNDIVFNILEYKSKNSEGISEYILNLKEDTHKYFMFLYAEDVATISDVNGRTLILMKE